MMAISDPNKSCDSFEGDLHDLLLGEIAPDAKLRIENHLSACAACRVALEEARQGLLALEALAEPPLPYRETDVHSTDSPGYQEETWHAFKGGLQARRPVSGDPWGLRLLAAAALLLVGIGLGVQVGTRRPTPTTSIAVTEERVEPETIASLARIELLADVGVAYTQGVRDLLDHMAGMDAEQATPAELEATREIARDLVRDGRLLRRTLDPMRDRTLLAAVNRAELVLEEIAAVGTSGLGAPSPSVRLAVNDDVLRNRLTSVKIDRRPETEKSSAPHATSIYPQVEDTTP